jgi:outer membrane lipoprotein SlyB
MKRSLTIPLLAIASFLPLTNMNAQDIQPAIYHPSTHNAVVTDVVYSRYHRRHRVRRTIKRVGIGAAGGAAIGAIAGGGPGAAIGAIAGGGAGAVYDAHERHKGH